MEEFTLNKMVLNTTTFFLGFAGVAYLIVKYKRTLKDINKNALNNLTINVISDKLLCDQVVLELMRKSKQYCAIGFDCEWVTEKGRRNPVALLQLSTHDGYCGLFRLSQMKHIPQSLKEILEDKSIYKVGVAPGDDAKYIFQDYGVLLKSTLDIRHIAKLCGQDAGGLSSLSKSLLGISLDKSWRIRCSNWEQDNLTIQQVNYAAADAHVAVLMFVKLINLMSTKKRWFFTKETDILWNDLDSFCCQFVDRYFKYSKPVTEIVKKNGYPKKNNVKLEKPYKATMRLKPLYHNCFLEAPDGEVLCTCDIKKATWYAERELGDIVKEDPLTVRLRFEPAGRAVGQVGQYYRNIKKNCCVVCGLDESYIKKNVVPKEYRKYFPDVMKDHSCHDVVLLCASCHQRSNMADKAMRASLAAKCNAPLPNKDFCKLSEDQAMKQVRSAARALYFSKEKLPEERREKFDKIVRDHYNVDHITPELLMEAIQIEFYVENSDYEAHGRRVVEWHQRGNRGLLELEQAWRKHFLNVMQPQHMPSLWSITHNEERLKVRLAEGRVTEEQLLSIGLTSWIPEMRSILKAKQSE